MILKNFIELHHDKVTVIQTTTGEMAVSDQHIFGGFNLGLHVKDNPMQVHQNRMTLLAQLQQQYPHIQQIHWLNQVHGNDVHLLIDNCCQMMVDADAHISTLAGTALAIMTADCVPIMITSEQGEMIGAVHAGWQGLAKNVIAHTVQNMQQTLAKQQQSTNTRNWQAWIGACIAQQHYEVDERVKTAVLASVPIATNEIDNIFLPNPQKQGHFFANLAKVAEIQLNQCGIENVAQSALDSYADERFYSHRQQTQQNLGSTGRMATLIFRSLTV